MAKEKSGINKTSRDVVFTVGELVDALRSCKRDAYVFAKPSWTPILKEVCDLRRVDAGKTLSTIVAEIPKESDAPYNAVVLTIKGY